MDKQCTSCRQLLADEAVRCLHCGARQSPTPTDNPLWGTESEAEIDLGSPVRVGVGPTGPPSGASFISWNAMIRARKQSLQPGSLGPETALAMEAAAENQPRTVPGGAPHHALTPAPTATGRWQPGIVGFIVGGLAAAAIWLAGLEPPETWRQPVLRWLYGGAAEPAAPASPSRLP
jgi:hypothetical protein